MSAQAVTTERQDLHQIIDTLSGSSREKLKHYIEFLRYEDWIEEQEEAEDIAYINSFKPEELENAMPLEDVLKELGL
jgi:hypothetical protein